MSQNALARSAWFPPENAEVVERGSLFPLGTYRTPDGQEVTALAFPQPMRDALDALGYAGGMQQDPAAPQGYVSQNALIRGGQGLAESAMVGSLVAPRPANALTIFAGRRAKTADHGALGRAEGLEAGGAAPEYIWKNTGWFRGADGQWRFEIDDSQASLTPWDRNIHGAANEAWPAAARARSGVPEQVRSMQFGEYMNHPDLAAAYGDLPTVRYDMEDSYRGAYSPNQNQIYMSLRRFNDADDPGRTNERSTGLHEVQHFVQEQEGFASGGNPQEMDQYIAQLPNPVEPAMQDKLRRELYRRLAGEVEARTVQARRDLTPEQRRARPPWLDYDVDADKQIVRRDPGMNATNALLY